MCGNNIPPYNHRTLDVFYITQIGHKYTYWRECVHARKFVIKHAKKKTPINIRVEYIFLFRIVYIRVYSRVFLSMYISRSEFSMELRLERYADALVQRGV